MADLIMAQMLKMMQEIGERENEEHHHYPMHLSGLAPGEELIPECEVIFEDEDDGLDSKFEWCEKNPRHSNFIPICDFKMDHLPSDLRTDNVMDFIRTRINLTVRIRIPYTSMDRPDYITWEGEKRPYPYMHHKGHKNFTRNGTGRLMSVSPVIKERCPCPDCVVSQDPCKEYYELIVRTVTHNVFNDEEASIAVVDCFFNHEDDEENGFIKKIFGLKIDDSESKKESMFNTDICDLVCVSHNVEIVERISELLFKAQTVPTLPDFNPKTQVIISHPHGCTKRISIGTGHYFTIPLRSGYKLNTPTQLPEGTTRYSVKLSSSSSPSSSSSSSCRDVNGEKTKDWNLIPSGTTFTLPPKAQYTMRYYVDEHPKYLKFPPGTKFSPPDGTSLQTQIPDDAEFEVSESFNPEHYYTQTIVGCCAGTGGATVYSNLTEDELLTDLDHTPSKLRSGRLFDVPPQTIISPE